MTSTSERTPVFENGELVKDPIAPHLELEIQFPMFDVIEQGDLWYAVKTWDGSSYNEKEEDLLRVNPRNI